MLNPIFFKSPFGIPQDLQKLQLIQQIVQGVQKSITTWAPRVDQCLSVKVILGAVKTTVIECKTCHSTVMFSNAWHQ